MEIRCGDNKSIQMAVMAPISTIELENWRNVRLLYSEKDAVWKLFLNDNLKRAFRDHLMVDLPPSIDELNEYGRYALLNKI